MANIEHLFTEMFADSDIRIQVRFAKIYSRHSCQVALLYEVRTAHVRHVPETARSSTLLFEINDIQVLFQKYNTQFLCQQELLYHLKIN